MDIPRPTPPIETAEKSVEAVHSIPDAGATAWAKKKMREAYGLSENATEQELIDAREKASAKNAREAYGLSENATEQELKDAREKASAKNAREAYGLSENATEQELKDAREKASAAIKEK